MINALSLWDEKLFSIMKSKSKCFVTLSSHDNLFLFSSDVETSLQILSEKKAIIDDLLFHSSIDVKVGFLFLFYIFLH
jgi:hypothetical protein